MNGQRWRIRLSEPARADIREIFRWTSERFGAAQADIYGEIIHEALDALRDGPSILGVRHRPDVAPGLYTFPIGRNRRGRHIVVFRSGQDQQRPTIIVGRILHDAMDPTLHIPPPDDEG